MSKKLLALFLVLGLMAYAEDTNTVASDTTAESSAEENVATTEVTKQVISQNKELSRGVEKKGFFRKVLDKLFG